MTPTRWTPSSTPSWYFFRYCSPGYEDGPFDPADVRRWMPVDQYVGGVEHAILHLLYMRFFTKVLYDMGMVDFEEPMRRLLNQGQVINQGKAMSKSLGNGVDLGVQIDAFGVDAVRLTVVFAGPPEEDIDWADVSPCWIAEVPAARVPAGGPGDQRAGRPEPSAGDLALRRETHRLLADIDQPLLGQRFNVAVARIMELVNATRKAMDGSAGTSRPRCPRGRRGGHHRPEPGSAVRRRGDVGTAGPRPVGRECDAGRRLIPALLVTRVGDLCRAGSRQGTRPAGGAARASARTSCAPDALAEESVVRALAGREIAKVIIRAPKLVSIVALAGIVRSDSAASRCETGQRQHQIGRGSCC